MDTSVRHTTAIALLAVGCGFSAASQAYSAAEDAEAQDREVRAAYDRGYQAAKEEMAHAPATNAAANAPAATAPPQTAGAVAQKPILDFKHTYSDSGEVQTVMTVPVTVKPLADGQGAQGTAATAAAADEQAAPAAEQAAARADDAAPPATYRPKPRTYAQVPPQHPVAATPPAREEVAPQESLADDEAVDNEPQQPRSAQIYSTQGVGYAQPPQPQAQYAPPPTASRPPPQPYNYAPRPVYSQPQPADPQQYAQQYAQQPVYAPPRPAYYAPPPAPWGAQQYQPQPQTRWVYWSPQYGRWMYY